MIPVHLKLPDRLRAMDFFSIHIFYRVLFHNHAIMQLNGIYQPIGDGDYSSHTFQQ